MSEMLTLLFRLHNEYMLSDDKQAFIGTLDDRELKELFINDHKRRISIIESIKEAEEKREQAITEGKLLASGKTDDNYAETTDTSLSVSIIVKNEEETIEKTIFSTYPVADEIVVVDTGSKDDTPDVIRDMPDKEGKIKVIEKTFEPWSFADARNFAISKCLCDFILFLDADEILRTDNEWFVNELEGTKDDIVISAHVIIYSELSHMEIHGFPAVCMNQARIFPNREDISWVHDLHNEPRLPEGTHITPAPSVKIHHVDDKKKNKQRYKRNKRYIKQYEEKDPSFRKYHMLLKLYAQNEEHKKAVEAGLDAFKLFKELSFEDKVRRNNVLLNIVKEQFALGVFDESMEYLREHDEITGGTSADCQFYKHIAFEKNEQYGYAHNCLERWNDLASHQDNQPIMVFETLRHTCEALTKLDLYNYWENNK